MERGITSSRNQRAINDRISARNPTIIDPNHINVLLKTRFMKPFLQTNHFFEPKPRTSRSWSSAACSASFVVARASAVAAACRRASSHAP